MCGLDFKILKQNIPFIVLIVICFYMVFIFAYRSSHLLLGDFSSSFLQPKTCVEFKVFKHPSNDRLLNNSINLPSDLNIIIDNLIPLSSNIEQEQRILASRQSCYYAKDIIALNEAVTQEESVAILAIFVPIFALLLSVASYFWVNTWKKDVKRIRRESRLEVERIRADSKQESVYFSKLLRRIEEVGARYTAYLMDEEKEKLSIEEPSENLRIAINAMQIGREIENNILTLSNNSHSDNGKAEISLKTLHQYIDKKDIAKSAPYLLSLRDVLDLIKNQEETSDNITKKINIFIASLNM